MPRPRSTLFQVRFAPRGHRGHHWKIVGYPTGKRKQLWFLSEKAAKSRAQDLNEEITAHGTQDILTAEQRSLTLQCIKKLAPYQGKTLLDATNFYVQHLEATNRSVPINQLTSAVGRDFQRRVPAECSQRHCETMLGALRHLEARFGDRASSTITGSEIKAWLSGSQWATKTRNNLLNYWGNAFNVAIELKMLSVNPLTDIKRFNASKVSKKDHPKFLTVEQMSALLDNADPGLIPYLALCGFAGLRSAEAQALDWKYVEIQRKLIIVPEHISKTGQERKVPIQPNLLAWLRPHAQTSGPLVPKENFEGSLTLAKQAAGLWPWTPRYQNSLRKSFCSYHYEAFGSADRTAEYAGHDLRMLVKIYRYAVSHEQAQKYWDIFPSDRGELVRKA